MTVCNILKLVNNRPWFFGVDSATGLRAFITGLVASGNIYSADETESQVLDKLASFPIWYALEAQIPVDKWADHIELFSASKWDSIQFACEKIMTYLRNKELDRVEYPSFLPNSVRELSSFAEFWHPFLQSRKTWGIERLSDFFAFHFGFTFATEDFFQKKCDDHSNISLNPNSKFSTFVKGEIGVNSSGSIQGILLELNGNSPFATDRLSDLVTKYLRQNTI